MLHCLGKRLSFTKKDISRRYSANKGKCSCFIGGTQSLYRFCRSARICGLLHHGIDESRRYSVKSLFRSDSTLVQQMSDRKHRDLFVGSMVKSPWLTKNGVIQLAA